MNLVRVTDLMGRWRLWLEMGTSEFAIAGLTLLYPQEMVGRVPVPRGKLRKVKIQGLGCWTWTGL